MPAVDPVKCTLKTFGTFSTPSFGGVGEPYVDKHQRDDRTTGRQFLINKQRLGQLGDNWNRGNYGKREPVKRESHDASASMRPQGAPRCL